jgi:hypothetical protein
MTPKSTNPSRADQWATCLAVGLALGLAGCHGTECGYGNYLVEPAPPGTSVNQAIDTQAANAAKDDFVVYSNEWLADSTVLGPAGKRHIDRIAKKLSSVPYPVIVEPTGNVDLDRSRREALVTVLVMRGIGDAEQRVVIGYSSAEGLFGDEAERIYDQMLNPGMGGYGGGHGFGGYGGSAYRRHVGPGSFWGGFFGGRSRMGGFFGF